MDTMTTIEAVERTESGAFKITLLGDVVAGTRDEEIGALAERLAGDDEANPVQVKLQKLDGGKLLIKEMTEITPPPELGGEEDDQGAANTPPEVVEQMNRESAEEAKPEPTQAPALAEQTVDDQLKIALTLSDDVLLMEIRRRMDGGEQEA